MRETTRIWSLVCLTPKLQPSWPNANLFSCLSTSVSKAPMLHNNLLYLGLLLIFPPCCFHLSWVLHLEQPDISPWFCLARKESSFVGGWSLTKKDLWKGSGFPQWLKRRPASLLSSQRIYESNSKYSKWKNLWTFQLWGWISSTSQFKHFWSRLMLRGKSPIREMTF